MSENSRQIAIIGDRDSVLLAKAVGLSVYPETDPEKVSRLIFRLAQSGCRIIYVTEALYEACTETIEQYKAESFPAIIPIPDSHGPRGVAMARIKANVEKAIGADILFSEGR